MQQRQKLKVKLLFGKYEEFPIDWQIKTFGELFKFLRSGNNSRDDLQETGDVCYIHYGDIHAKWHSVLDCDLEEIPMIDKAKVQDLPFLKEGDLIIADASEDYEGSGASVLVRNVKDRKIVSGLHTIAIRNIDESISSDFKTYLNSIKFVKSQIIAYVTGISVYGLSKNNLKKIRIPLPPIKEQQKIATILSNVDELIQKTEQIIGQTQRLKKGLMQRLFTKGIGHTKFKKTELGEIPEEWKVLKLEEVGNLNAGGTPSRFVKEYWENGTIPWLSSGEIRNNIITDSNEKITEKGLSESAAKLFPKGTILIAITGQGLTRGRTALLKIDSSTNQSVIGIICKPTIIYNIFLWYYLQNHYWNLRNISQGSNQAGLNLNLLKSYKILLPSINEQQKIGSSISEIDNFIKKYLEYQNELFYLKKGLMQQLLTGKIRVKVDKNEQ